MIKTFIFFFEKMSSSDEKDDSSNDDSSSEEEYYGCEASFCTDEAPIRCTSCLDRWCAKHFYKKEHSDVILTRFGCGCPFPKDRCPTCYTEYQRQNDLECQLAIERFNHLFERYPHKLNEKEKTELDTWMKPLRKREEETKHMTEKKRKRWQAENYSEEWLLETRKIDRYETSVIITNDPCELFKQAEWGVMCFECVYNHYASLWRENSNIDIVTGKDIVCET